MDSQRKISGAVIRRLPGYYRYLKRLEMEGVQRISSQDLGQQMGLTASQIRQDFNCFGGFGQQGYGYNVEELRNRLASILGMTENRTAIIIGAGNLGHAIIKNFKFAFCGVTLKAAFDIVEQSSVIDGTTPLYSVSELSDYLGKNDIDIAILTLPAAFANDTALRLVECGIKGIWNFTNVELNDIPKNIFVENVHFSDSLLTLNYYLSQEAE